MFKISFLQVSRGQAVVGARLLEAEGGGIPGRHSRQRAGRRGPTCQGQLYSGAKTEHLTSTCFQIEIVVISLNHPCCIRAPSNINFK